MTPYRTFRPPFPLSRLQTFVHVSYDRCQGRVPHRGAGLNWICWRTGSSAPFRMFGTGRRWNLAVVHVVRAHELMAEHTDNGSYPRQPSKAQRLSGSDKSMSCSKMQAVASYAQHANSRQSAAERSMANAQDELGNCRKLPVVINEDILFDQHVTPAHLRPAACRQ